MRPVAFAKRCRPVADSAYSDRRPDRRYINQSSSTKRLTEVRTSLSVKPKGAMRRMRLPRVMAPPRGANESPNTVTISEPPRRGRCAWKVLRRVRTGSVMGMGVIVVWQ